MASHEPPIYDLEPESRSQCVSDNEEVPVVAERADPLPRSLPPYATTAPRRVPLPTGWTPLERRCARCPRQIPDRAPLHATLCPNCVRTTHHHHHNNKQRDHRGVR